MITGWILEHFAALVATMLGGLPDWDLPPYLTGSGPGTLPGLISSGMQALGGLGGWLPAHHVIAACSLVAGALLIAGTVHVVRIVASFLTLGGGST